MKAIFPDSKSLQPMPTPDVHANISGNTNSTTTFTPSNEPMQNTTSTQSALETVQPENTKSGNPVIFYFLGLIIILVIIFVYIKKRK